VFPAWRVDAARRVAVTDPNVPCARAGGISFAELAGLPELIARPPIGFEPAADYYGNNHIALARCDRCGVRLVKDGNHRLLQSTCRGTDETVFVYEVTSSEWLHCRGDMRHLCGC